MSPRKPTNDEMLGPGGLIVDVKPLMDYWEASSYEELDNKPIRLDQPLQSGLNRYPSNWVEGLCVSLGMIDKGDKRSKIKAAVAKLMNNDMVREVVAGLPKEGSQALSKVLQEGGWVKYPILSRDFGSEEQDSYFWKEKPPLSVIGQLRVRGLLLIGRHDLGGRQYKVAVVPQELREPLKAILSDYQEKKPSVKGKTRKKFFPGQVAPFYEVCPEVTAPEMRAVVISNCPGLPDDKYTFIDCYCLDPRCDCRIAYLWVVASSAPSKVLAAINFGWEPIRFYQEWFKRIGVNINDPEIANEIINRKGPSLCPRMEQTHLAPALLELIAPQLEEPTYLQVLKRR